MWMWVRRVCLPDDHRQYTAAGFAGPHRLGDALASEPDDSSLAFHHRMLGAQGRRDLVIDESWQWEEG